MSNVFRRAFFVLAVGCVSFSACAQSEITLRIGDPAPEVKYSQWIKGQPISSFDGDRLYVLEFWATWCGPCKAAMPNITKLQKEYEGKATFIGVDVWEQHGSEEKPYDSYLPAVAKFVKGNDGNMGYSVIADNNEQYMGNHWLKAAGQNGIPATFIVKNKRIIWIGHPISLDTTLPKILNGSYDMQAYKMEFDKRADESLKQSNAMSAALDPIQAAIKAKDFQKAFDLIEKAKLEQPVLKLSLNFLKFKTILENIGEEEAIKFAEEWQKDGKFIPAYILQGVEENDRLHKSTYLWAAKNCEAFQPEMNPMVYNMLASCYAKGGDYKKAINNQEKAVETAKTALKEGKLIGSVMDYTIVEYQEALDRYKNEEKASK
jgi:thiol-disulfide isomerase/thioredoxin